MTFTTFTFLVFLIMTFVGYWSMPTRRAQNALLLIAGYLFYGWWDLRFGVLLLASSCVDYFVGKRLALTEGKAARKRLLSISFVVNLGMLGFFKYFNFFADSFVVARYRDRLPRGSAGRSTSCCRSASASTRSRR